MLDAAHAHHQRVHRNTRLRLGFAHGRADTGGDGLLIGQSALAPAVGGNLAVPGVAQAAVFQRRMRQRVEALPRSRPTAS